MSVSDAIQTIQTDIGNPAEMEAAFRIEVAGHPPGGRREVLEAAYRQYWVLAQFDDPGQRAKILSLDEAIEAWKRELENPDVRRYYTGLILSQASHAKVAPARMRRLAAKLGGVK